MPVKITVKSHLTPVRMAITEKSTNKNVREGMEKREPSYTVGGNLYWCITMENSIAVPKNIIPQVPI